MRYSRRQALVIDVAERSLLVRTLMSRSLLAAGLVTCVVVATTSAGTAEEKEGPLDHVTFVDANGGGSFVAGRVAVRYVYSCEAGFTEILDRPLKDDAGCRGPFGDTIIEGSLNGKKAFAMYSVNDAAPCCYWSSYSENTTNSVIRGANWLASEDIPAIALDSEWYTIGPATPPFDPENGPMADGEFVPKLCRAD